MLLSPKHIHKLRKELAAIVDDETSVKKYASYADLPTNKIRFKGPSWSVWGNVIGKAINDPKKMQDLLEAILHDHPDNPKIIEYIDEITTRRELRFNNIARALKEKRCVLFLGPDVLQIRYNAEIHPFNIYLCTLLEEKMKADNVYFDKTLRDNIGYMSKCYSDHPNYILGDIGRLAKLEFEDKFVHRQVQENIFQLLAELPFKLVINANPDNLLFKKLQLKGQSGYQYEYYDISNKKIDPEEEEEVEEDSPATTLPPSPLPNVILYNIFGDFDNPNSILFTESDFLNFINQVLIGNPRLNNDVLNEFNDKDTYLFLGFDFEQWYFKVLFQLFKIKKTDCQSLSCNYEEEEKEEEDENEEEEDKKTTAKNNIKRKKMGVSTREFFEEEFKMYFVNNDLEYFIQDLKTRYDQQP